jgi:very-short-patch-repair endonuclease
MAPHVSFDDLRLALAEADFTRKLDVEEITGGLGRGVPGAAAMRRALRVHDPRWARTRSALEREFLNRWERMDEAMPEVNVRIRGFLVDLLWRRERVVVELDGEEAHGTRGRIAADRRRELRLRAAGFVVLRYSWRQITEEWPEVGADVRRHLAVARRTSPTDSR